MQMPSWMPEPGSPFDRVATFLLANLLWVMFAAIIITLPAATAGLFATLAPWVRGRDTELFSAFFGTMRRLWLKSSVIFVTDAVVGVIIFINFQVLTVMSANEIVLWLIGGANLFVALTLLMVNLYLWPLLVLFDLPLKRLVNVAVRLALGHPLWSITVLVLASLPLVIALFVPALLSIVVLFSTMALIINWGAWRIIRKYATPEELAELDQR